MSGSRKLWSVVLAVAALAIVACGDDGEPGAVASDDTAEPAPEGEVTVLAAASLTDAFTELGTSFEEANPGVTVTYSFGPSSGLATQIIEGAPADVFASASPSQMDLVAKADAAGGEPPDFATNQLQIAVPPDNPGGVRGLEDFAQADLLIGLCAEEVPCGQFGREALTNAGVTPAIDTNETDVRALLTKVESGELDAGIVYVTDVLASGDAVMGIDIPAGSNVTATYPIATLAEAAEPELAGAYLDYVLSDDGAALLGEYGFGPP